MAEVKFLVGLKGIHALNFMDAKQSRHAAAGMRLRKVLRCKWHSHRNSCGRRCILSLGKCNKFNVILLLDFAYS